MNKFLAGSGVCSRRAADDLIKAGRVTVNGLVAEPGTKVDPASDRVALDGRIVSAVGKTATTVIALNKPVMTVTTAKDPQGRPTVYGLLPDNAAPGRLFAIGRLDYFSEGLLLFTDNGELANRLAHPGTSLDKIYRVLVRGRPEPAALDTMRRGMRLAEGDATAPIAVAADAPGQGGDTWLTLTLHQGINRQIRRMCRDLNLTILRLIRVAQGPVKLDKLPKGACRRLTPDETTTLLRAVGMGEE